MKRRLLPYLMMLFGWLLLPEMLVAQSDAPLRVEFPAAKDQHDYNMAVADTMGLFVFYDAGSISVDTNRWICLHYDTNLVKINTSNIKFPPLTDFVASDYCDGILYLLLQKRMPKKSPPRTFIVAITPEKRTFEVSEIDGIQANDLSEIYATDGQLLLLATGSKSDLVYFYQPSTHKLTTLSDIFSYQVEFCTADTAARRWLIGLHQVTSAQDDLFLYEYSWADGSANLTRFPQQLPDHTNVLCQTARAFPLNADTVLLLGTYNSLSDRHSVNLHSGVYSVLFSHHQFDTLQTYNFTSLKSGSAANTPNANLNLQLQLGASTCTSEQYSIVSEVYYPDYSYTYNNHYNDYNYYSSAPTTVFLGYQFVNAYITTFDQTGHLLWDHYFPLTSISNMQLGPVVSLSYTEEDALIYYARNNRIFSTLINGYETLEKLTSMNIETMSTRDVVEYNQGTEMQRWYGDNFLVSGYQYLRNRDKATKAKRFVFFINKLEYR